jgi:signal transduction histidine kinase
MVESGPRYFDLQISTLYRRTTPTGRLVQLRDITARKAADLEREGLIDDLKAYAHTVAHDLKDPIGTIMMAVDMLLYSSAPPPSEHQQRFLSMMADNGRKTITIIDSLLLLAKVRDQEQIPVTATALVQSVSEAQKRLAASISAAQAEITVAQEWPSVLAYAPWVEEMWVNYLSNALKYGGTPPRIEVAAQVEGRMVRCFVRDHGPGLSAAQQAELFIPFSQIDPKQAKGHGLGLSIVKRIAERLGGTVGVDSTPGQGSTFYFTLPAA